MSNNPTFIPLERSAHRPVRIDAILAARMKRLVRARRRQMKRQKRQASDER